MKRLWWILLAVAAMTWAGIVPAAAQSGPLVVYSAAAADMNDFIVREFNRVYPNIRVDLISGGTGAHFTRLRAERSRPQADIMLTGGRENWDANLDLLQPYTVAQDAEFPDNVKHPQRLYYGFSMPLQAFIVNTQVLAAAGLDVPRRWSDLADPKYAGRLVLANPALSGSAYAQLSMMLDLFDWSFVERVIANATITPSSGFAYQSVAQGEYAIGVTGEINVFVMRQQGYPVIAVYPQEGTGLRFDAVGIIAGAPNLANARLFMDWVTSREVQQLLADQLNLRMVRPDVTPPAGLAPMQEITFMEYDADKAAANRQQYLETFEDVFARVGRR